MHVAARRFRGRVFQALHYCSCGVHVILTSAVARICRHWAATTTCCSFDRRSRRSHTLGWPSAMSIHRLVKSAEKSSYKNSQTLIPICVMCSVFPKSFFFSFFPLFLQVQIHKSSSMSCRIKVKIPCFHSGTLHKLCGIFNKTVYPQINKRVLRSRRLRVLKA